MKQEQIEKAAREFTDNLIAENHFDVNYEEDNYDAGSIHATDEVGVYAFIRGAEWRINSVWHDASEKPVFGENIIIEIKYDNGIKDYILPLRGDHPNVITDEQGICYLLLNAKVVRWAYVKDLMPELETK